MSAAAAGHAKIALESVKDYRFIQSNITRAAQLKLETHLPVQDGSADDKLRRRVQELLEQFVNEIMDTAKHSVLVNGLPATEQQLDSEPHYEAYDPGLLARVQALHVELEKETVEVTRMRREIPAMLESKYKEALSLDAAAARESAETATTDILSADEATNDATADDLVSIGEIPRKGQIEEAFNGGLELLKTLKRNVPATSAKLERANNVLDLLTKR